MVAAAITAIHRDHEQRRRQERAQHKHDTHKGHHHHHHHHHQHHHDQGDENVNGSEGGERRSSKRRSVLRQYSNLDANAVDPSRAASNAANSAQDDRKPSNESSTQRRPPVMLPYQEQVAHFYETAVIQIAVAGLIFGNFIVSALQAQVLPNDGEPMDYVFFAFEIFFNVAFTLELFMNMYGKFFVRFWLDAWNWFDFGIVTISLLSMVLEDLPGISVLRLFRAFRVFRLFKRIKSLRLIIEGVMASLPGVSNAFIVLGVIMSIWSIMGVNFFGDDEEFEYFYGNYAKAMLTHIQIMTLDSWASQIARPIIYTKSVWYTLFFVSYNFVTAIMMMNVVVAILLDKFVSTMAKFDFAEDLKKAEEELHAVLKECPNGDNVPRLEEAIDKMFEMRSNTNFKDEEPATELIREVFPGSISIPLASIEGFDVGDPIIIQDFIDSEINVIKSISPFELEEPLNCEHDPRTTIKRLRRDDELIKAQALLDEIHERQEEQQEEARRNAPETYPDLVGETVRSTSKDLVSEPVLSTSKTWSQDTEILLAHLGNRTRDLCRRLDKSATLRREISR